jgi:hypothetical protein
MMFQVPEADESGDSVTVTCCHNIEENEMIWGLGRKVPGVGKDFVYLGYSFRDCCVM